MAVAFIGIGVFAIIFTIFIVFLYIRRKRHSHQRLFEAEVCFNDYLDQNSQLLDDEARAAVHMQHDELEPQRT